MSIYKPSTKIAPLGSRVLIKVDDPDSITPSGLFLPPKSSNDAKVSLGVVLNVGSGKVNNDGSLCKMSIKIGDRVMISSWSGTEVEENGSKYRILNEDDVLAILK